VAKVRVYELAKEFGVESKVVMTKLQELGEFVRSASSTVEPPVVRKLKEAFPTGNGAPAAGAGAPAPKKTSARPGRPAAPADAPAAPAVPAPFDGAAAASVAAPAAPVAPTVPPTTQPAAQPVTPHGPAGRPRLSALRTPEPGRVRAPRRRVRVPPPHPRPPLPPQYRQHPQPRRLPSPRRQPSCPRPLPRRRRVPGRRRRVRPVPDRATTPSPRAAARACSAGRSASGQQPVLPGWRHRHAAAAGTASR
jgi:translation initiation factor IF-2